nr:hypothetical protein [uncultured Mediterraneibacter sp.]
MSKWCGKIGFSVTEEYEPGSYEPKITERTYYGDVIENRYKRQPSDSGNDNITISQQISIVADPYVLMECWKIAYIEYLGNLWKVTNVTPQFPRLILTLGGMYNENTP